MRPTLNLTICAVFRLRQSAVRRRRRSSSCSRKCQSTGRGDRRRHTKMNEEPSTPAIERPHHAPRESLEVLCRCTKFNKREIKLIYRNFKQVRSVYGRESVECVVRQDCPNGYVDVETLKEVLHRFFPYGSELTSSQCCLLRSDAFAMTPSPQLRSAAKLDTSLAFTRAHLPSLAFTRALVI